MPVLFGQKVTRDTMVQKLSKLVSPEECERCTIDTLSKQVFVKGSWDNTQFYRQLKYQCGKTSAKMEIATSDIFLDSELPDLAYEIPFDEYEENVQLFRTINRLFLRHMECHYITKFQ